MALRHSDHGDQNLTRFHVVWLPSNAVPEQTYRSSLTQIVYKTGRKYVFCYTPHQSQSTRFQFGEQRSDYYQDVLK